MAAVVNDERVTRLYEISRHGLPHDPEADETDYSIAHDDFSYFMLGRSARQLNTVQRKLPKSWIEKINASGPGMIP